jgi:hypothetical protein
VHADWHKNLIVEPSISYCRYCKNGLQITKPETLGRRYRDHPRSGFDQDSLKMTDHWEASTKAFDASSTVTF